MIFRLSFIPTSCARRLPKSLRTRRRRLLSFLKRRRRSARSIGSLICHPPPVIGHPREGFKSVRENSRLTAGCLVLVVLAAVGFYLSQMDAARFGSYHDDG